MFSIVDFITVVNIRFGTPALPKTDYQTYPDPPLLRILGTYMLNSVKFYRIMAEKCTLCAPRYDIFWGRVISYYGEHYT